MPYYVYILQSITSGRLYIGQTGNVEDRLQQHNAGKSKYTSGKGPWELLFYRAVETRSEAMLLERKLKAWKNPEKVKDWLARQVNG